MNNLDSHLKRERKKILLIKEITSNEMLTYNKVKLTMFDEESFV